MSSQFSPSSGPLGLAIAGIGGFAHVVTDLALSSLDSSVRLLSVGDPAKPQHGDRVRCLEGMGVKVFADFADALRQSGVEGVWLPVPIGLHRPMCEQAFSQGRAVLCEKPLAGCVADADAMIATRDRAGLPAAVGFHDCFDPEVLRLKRRVLNGELGNLESVSVIASWPRDSAYYQRAAWTGRERFDGNWVRDNPANNALAHYLMLALFLLGGEDLTAASISGIEARAFRVRDIETFDTVSARGRVSGDSPWFGLPLDVHFTHVGEAAIQPQIALRGSKGLWLWKLAANENDLCQADRVFLGNPRAREYVLPRFVDLCRGRPQSDRPYATFETARAHTHAVEQISSSASVATVPMSACVKLESINSGEPRLTWPGLVESMIRAARRGELLPADPGLVLDNASS
ncbi:MAG: Gfo/Idh/MocA family oxidoreductase [Planctomycetota bacterium]